MTRQEAKTKFWKKGGVFERGLDINFKKVISSYFLGSEFDKFIDEIYDDFENRNCKNCKWFDGTWCISLGNALMNDGKCFIVQEDFGCFRFEKLEVANAH